MIEIIFRESTTFLKTLELSAFFHHPQRRQNNQKIYSWPNVTHEGIKAKHKPRVTNNTDFTADYFSQNLLS